MDGKNARRMAGDSPGLSAVAGRLLPESDRDPLTERGLSSADAWARSRRNSSMRARIAGKSSAAWGRVTFPPVLLFVEPGSSGSPAQIEKLWLTAQASVSFPIAAFRMDGVQPSDEAGSGLVSITVLSVTPMRAGKLFALASVEIDIDGVRIEVRGIRAMRVPTGATRVELPTFRDAAGQSRAAIVLPDEVHGPIGDAVIEALIERGLAKRRFTVPIPD
jgi:hypothetical protein